MNAPCERNAAAGGSKSSGRKGHASQRPRGPKPGKTERAAWLVKQNELQLDKGIKRRDRTTRGERKTGWGRMERKKGKLEMKPKSRKFSRRFLHPQSLAAEAARTSRDSPRVWLFKASTSMFDGAFASIYIPLDICGICGGMSSVNCHLWGLSKIALIYLSSFSKVRLSNIFMF